MTVFSVSANDLARIVADPPLVEHLFDCQPGSRAAADLPRQACNLERAWDGLHLVLAGTRDAEDPVRGFLLCGGEDIGTIDVGYGPARAFAPDAVARIHEFLDALTREGFAARIDHAALVADDAYSISGDPENDRDWLSIVYDELRAFVAQTATARDGIVIALY